MLSAPARARAPCVAAVVSSILKASRTPSFPSAARKAHATAALAYWRYVIEFEFSGRRAQNAQIIGEVVPSILQQMLQRGDGVEARRASSGD